MYHAPEKTLEVPAKKMAPIGSRRFVAAFRPLQVNSKIRCGHLPTCGMAATGESHRSGREEIDSRGETAMCPTRTWYSNSACRKSTSLAAEV